MVQCWERLLISLSVFSRLLLLLLYFFASTFPCSHFPAILSPRTIAQNSETLRYTHSWRQRQGKEEKIEWKWKEKRREWERGSNKKYVVSLDLVVSRSIIPRHVTLMPLPSWDIALPLLSPREEKNHVLATTLSLSPLLLLGSVLWSRWKKGKRKKNYETLSRDDYFPIVAAFTEFQSVFFPPFVFLLCGYNFWMCPMPILRMKAHAISFFCSSHFEQRKDPLLHAVFKQ